MSGSATVASHIGTDPNLCPSCHQPWNNSNSEDACSSLKVSSKRNESSLHPSVLATQKKRRVLRSDALSTTQFTRPWCKGMPVMVRVWLDKHIHKEPITKPQGWMEGVVFDIQPPDGSEYNIVVHVQDLKGNWVVPRTIYQHNADPIPSVMPSNPRYKLCNYIMGRDELEEGLSSIEVKHWRPSAGCVHES